ncbi:hypothetical protein [Yinghuangia soli]|uniref:Uncharacterized protein n=1 Tax=Yinghuangia soli TaxID=2908204 RepID=A0AA41U1M9_9ACTN|nr:hypothetical protein [Yinghuangia soli]MCF2529816.1 hypothetical protein [Yinghuangia soli]
MLRKLTGDPACKNGTCPTLWITEAGTGYIVQGRVVDDPEHLAQLGLPAGESAVFVPAEVLEAYFRADR